jgi:hypothetical protein
MEARAIALVEMTVIDNLDFYVSGCGRLGRQRRPNMYKADGHISFILSWIFDSFFFFFVCLSCPSSDEFEDEDDEEDRPNEESDEEGEEDELDEVEVLDKVDEDRFLRTGNGELWASLSSLDEEGSLPPSKSCCPSLADLPPHL